MTPTLFGRIQTRIFVVVVIGGLWTALVTPLLPGIPPEMALADVYAITFRVLFLVLVCGLGWEFVYHGLQQLRWEKDWPTLFGLITGVNEGILVWLIASAWIDVVPGSAFLVHFTTTWLVIWAWVNGPMRVVFIRWRFQGGRLI